MPIGSSGGRVVAQLRPQDQMKRQLMAAIQGWIEKEGLTQSMAARRMGIPRSVIYDVVGGKCAYSFGRLLDAWVRCGGTWWLDLKHVRSMTAQDFPRES